MFTWICPQCGREVPPAYTECPDCAAKEKQAAPAAPPQPPAAPSGPPPSATAAFSAAPPAQQYGPPPAPAAPSQVAQPAVYPPPGPPGYQPQQTSYAPPPQRRAGMPTWLLTLVFAFAFVGVGAGIYWLVGYARGGGATAAPPVTVESPAAKPGAKTNPLQKYIEVAGVRFYEEKNKPLVKFIVVNHSGADISGLAGNVTVWGRTQKSEEEAAGSFAFKADLKPFDSKELSAPLTTKLKFYALPDWQNVSTDLQITAPAAP